MSHSIFEGSAAAVVTPMNGYGNLDFDAFGRLLEWMIREGTDAVVVNGTTGESATLDDKEKMAVIRYAVRQVDGRIPVIAGTGSNCTEHAVELSRKAQELGADALLQVTPYYNKASQEGLVRHFTQVADHVSIPILLYNVPSRTGGNHTAGNLQDSVGTSQYTGDKGGQRQPVPDSQDSSPVRAGI